MPNMQDQETMNYFGHGGLVLDPRRNAAQIREENQTMDAIRARRMHAQEFAAQQASRAQDESTREEAQKIARGQTEAYREALLQNKAGAAEDRRMGNLDRLLQNNPQMVDAA